MAFLLLRKLEELKESDGHFADRWICRKSQPLCFMCTFHTFQFFF